MRQRLIKNLEGKYEWINIQEESEFKGKHVTNAQGENLTVDGYIDKYGGIESPVDNKVYRSKASYMDHLKANQCHIKDY